MQQTHPIPRRRNHTLLRLEPQNALAQGPMLQRLPKQNTNNQRRAKKMSQEDNLKFQKAAEKLLNKNWNVALIGNITVVKNPNYQMEKFGKNYKQGKK